MTDRCSIPGCRAEVELNYMGHGICTHHWSEFTADDLRMVLGIEVKKEIDMAAKKKTETENPAPVAADTTPEAQVAPTPARRRKKTPTGDTAAQGAAPVETTTAEPKPKKERATKAAESKPAKEKEPDSPNRVFAIRVTDNELAAIHRASGPRNATRFIRAVAAAFANGDEEAFRAALAEAGKLRA